MIIMSRICQENEGILMNSLHLICFGMTGFAALETSLFSQKSSGILIRSYAAIIASPKEVAPVIIADTHIDRPSPLN